MLTFINYILCKNAVRTSHTKKSRKKSEVAEKTRGTIAGKIRGTAKNQRYCKKSEVLQKIRGTAKNQRYRKKSELPQKIRGTAKNLRYRKKSETEIVEDTVHIILL